MVNVNLIAERERQRRTGETAGRVAFFVAVLMFIAAMATLTVQQTKVRAMRANVEATQIEIAKLEREKSRITLVQRQLDSKRPIVELLRSARDSEAKWCVALAHISSALPDRVSLNAVRSSKSLRPSVIQEGAKPGAPPEREGFTLVGQAASGDLVGQFITNLQKTPSFGEVYLQYTRKRAGGAVGEMYQFEIQALLATGEASS